MAAQLLLFGVCELDAQDDSRTMQKPKRPRSLSSLINTHRRSLKSLSGLQTANRALVIQEGERAPEAGGGAFTMELPDNIKVRMRTSEVINPDGSVDLQPDKIVTEKRDERRDSSSAGEQAWTKARSHAPPFASQSAEKDNPYAEMSFPTAEYRLLALFRFWNVINYFFPYKNLIGDSWETVLPRYIAKFESNKDVTDYQLTVREMVAEIRDSHGGARNTNAAGRKVRHVSAGGLRRIR